MTAKYTPARKIENFGKLDQATLFIKHADQYLKSAKVLTTSKPFHFFPAFYLIHHAVELGLKAHLIILGVRQKTLKGLNHDLVALANNFEMRAQKKNYSYRLSPMDQRKIIMEGGQYARKCFEYPDPNFLPIIPIGSWLSLAEILIREAKSKIRNPA
jgi:HEPN domain-containing protein